MWESKLLILFLFSGLQVQANPTKVQNNEWDYMIGSIRWLPSACVDQVSKHSYSTCSMPDEGNSWGLNSLQPINAQALEYCNASWTFDPNNVKPLERSLHQLWRNIEDENKDYQLWADEWNRYGTCLANNDRMNTQLKHFSVGLYFIEYTRISFALAQSNIVPNDTRVYTLDEIYDAIENSPWLRRPRIECRSVAGKQYLLEVQFCFDKELYMVECSNVFGSRTSSCKANGIIYPLSDNLPVKTRMSVVKAYELVNNLQLFSNLYGFI